MLAMFISSMTFAQVSTITGTVTDGSTGEGLPGVSVIVKGTTNGTATDLDGKFTIDVPNGETLLFSYIGYQSQQIVVTEAGVINVALQTDTENLDEVVVIGYGQVKKDDATGSVTAISSDDFNKGAITSPQELLSGRTAGVQITSGGGAPGSESTIRIRGGSSLSASNDPLIVIDGVPIDDTEISGMRNPLNTIHPSDIETFTVLKDASATAIYGSRASNGVIIITTKKGKKGSPFRVSYNGYTSVGVKSGDISVLNGDEYRSMVQTQLADNSKAISLLGTENTDWQNEIFQTSISHDHNLSLSGTIKDMPFRTSVAYSDQEGILKTSELQRTTASFSFNPSFFEDHLKVNVNLKGMLVDNRFADKGAIGTAIEFDPTKPVYDNNSPYGGYYAWTIKDQNGDPILDPLKNPTLISIATDNPVAKLMQKRDVSNVKRSIGNVQFDYRFHFLPELRANMNMGYDITDSEGTVAVPEIAAMNYNSQNGGGIAREYTQEKENTLFDFYLNYMKDLKGIDSKLDVMAGYSWQHFWKKSYEYETNVAGTVVNTPANYNPTEYYLVSFFGRMNFTYKDKYLLTGTLRRDGTSRFHEDNRWGLFPSVAFAWKMKDEPFFKNVDALSSLKMRVGYGVTGQQNIIDDNDYPYLPKYTFSQADAQYQFGDNFITTLRPEGYDSNIKWEETTTYNVGFDFGFLDNKITGTIDAYYRKTDDLINTIPVPAGTNLTNQILTNVGDLENKGIEFSLNARPITGKDFSWELGFNMTYNKNEITKLTLTDDPNYLGVATGDISGGTGNKIQIHSVGKAANSYFVYEQVYDDAGKPIEGLYVDRNGDNQITTDDKYHYRKAAPDVYMGFSSRMNYKNWDFSFAGRVSLGNYVYNNIESKYALYSEVYNSNEYLKNVPSLITDAGFTNAQFFSDYYIQNASFLRLDNISLGYNFSKVFDKANIRVYTTVQNAFVITDYKGLDPEIQSGIDNDVYPRPRTFLLGVSVDF